MNRRREKTIKKPAGVTVDIETIREVVKQTLGEWHEIRISCIGESGSCVIYSLAGNIAKEFNNLGELYSWILARQIELHGVKEVAITAVEFRLAIQIVGKPETR